MDMWWLSPQVTRAQALESETCHWVEHAHRWPSTPSHCVAHTVPSPGLSLVSACSSLEQFKAHLHPPVPKWFLFCIAAEPRSPPSSVRDAVREEVQSLRASLVPAGALRACTLAELS